MDTYRKVTIKAERIYSPKVYGEDEFINEIEIFNISRHEPSLLRVEKEIVLEPMIKTNRNLDYKIKLSAGEGCVFSHPIVVDCENGNNGMGALVIRKLYPKI